MPPKGTRASYGDVIHVEVYVVPRRDRTEFRRRARKPIALVREITHTRGGSGPHFYRVDTQHLGHGVLGLGNLFKVRSNEDLWVEITFYPNSQSRQAIMNEVWKNEELAASIEALESLNSKRPGAWAMANAVLQTL